MRPCANCKEDIGNHSEGKLQKCLIKLSDPPKGELRTSIGSIVITNKSQVKLARNLLDVFEEELEK